MQFWHKSFRHDPDPVIIYSVGLILAETTLWIAAYADRTGTVRALVLDHGVRVKTYNEGQTVLPSCGGHTTTAAGSEGRRAPFSTDTASHTHTARSLACPLLTLLSAPPFSNGIFRSNGAPLPPRPPPSHVHAGWMVSATKTPTSSAPSQDYLFPLYM